MWFLKGKGKHAKILWKEILIFLFRYGSLKIAPSGSCECRIEEYVKDSRFLREFNDVDCEKLNAALRVLNNAKLLDLQNTPDGGKEYILTPEGMRLGHDFVSSLRQSLISLFSSFATTGLIIITALSFLINSLHNVSIIQEIISKYPEKYVLIIVFITCVVFCYIIGGYRQITHYLKKLE